MVLKTGRKITGGKYIKQRKKKSREIAGQRRIIKLSDKEKKKSKRTLGGNKKSFLLGAKFVNVNQNGKTKRVEIKNVAETPSNKFLARQNIITKGTIIETELGKVKITNRPTQESVLNGIILR